MEAPKTTWITSPPHPTTRHCLGGSMGQGRLKIWTEHSTLILLISKSFEVEPPKFQHFYNYTRNEFSPNLEGVAKKNGPARSIRSFRHFWREIQIWRHLEPSYLMQSGHLLRLTTGENLVLISQTTFEKLKFQHFSLSIPSLVGIKIVFENYFYTN